MIRLLVLTLTLALMGWSSAYACSPAFPPCDENGRCESWHETPKWIKKTRLDKSFEIIAVITAEAIPLAEPKSKYSSAAKLTVKRILKGSPSPSFEIDNLAVRPNPSRNATKDPKYRFGLWDHMNIGAQFVRDYSSASCSREIKNSLIDGKPYLVFIRNYGPNNYHLKDAILIENELDPLVDEFESILQGRDNRPNLMDAKTYLEHMKGFVEVSITTCPTKEDYRYTDSRFATAKKQEGSVYSIIDSYNYKEAAIDLRDLASYRDLATNVNGQIKIFRSNLEKNINSKPSSEHIDAYFKIREVAEQKRKEISFTCESNTNYLVVFKLPNQRGSMRYIPIQNGVADISEIITNIELKGHTKVNVADVKRWIREGTAE